MSVDLMMGPLGINFFRTVHTGQYGAVHGALLDDHANRVDAGAKNITTLVGIIEAPSSAAQRLQKKTETIVIFDDGPGPRERERSSGEFKVHPTDVALRRMVFPGCSTSADDPTKIGQAGVGTMSFAAALGDTAIFATHTPETIFTLMVSLPFNARLAAEGQHAAKLIELKYDKGSDAWTGDTADFITYGPFNTMAAYLHLLCGGAPATRVHEGDGPLLKDKGSGGLVTIVCGLSPEVKIDTRKPDLCLPKASGVFEEQSTSAFLQRSWPHSEPKESAEGAGTASHSQSFSLHLGVLGKPDSVTALT